MFNNARRRSGNRPLTAKVRSAKDMVRGQQTAPVFSGQLVAKPRRSNKFITGFDECVDIVLNLTLNVPRFIAAQAIEGTGDFTPISAVQPFRLAGSREALTSEIETAFGGDSNVLMGDERIFRYAFRGGALTHLYRLIDTILETIRNFLVHRIESRNSEISCAPIYTLKKAEWYAEYSTEDPRRQVNRLMPFLSRQSKAGNVFKRRLTGQVRSFGPNSIGFQIQLSEGIKQTTYSKTNRRIRFELKYSRTCFNRLFGRRSGLQRTQLTNALVALKNHAERELGRIFDALNPVRTNEVDEPQRDDLCMLVGLLSADSHVAEEILRSLRDTGRVTVPNGSELGRTVRNLKDAGILCFVRRSVYTTSGSFERALQELMAQPGAAMSREMRAKRAGAKRPKKPALAGVSRSAAVEPCEAA